MLQRRKIFSFMSKQIIDRANLRISRATSGKESKFDVSSIERTSTGIAAGRSLICSQSTPRKNDTLFTSSMPFWDPNRRSASQQNRTIVSRASSDIGVSGGKISVSRQFITLRYVSCGSETELPSLSGFRLSQRYLLTVGAERWIAHQHLVHDDA